MQIADRTVGLLAAALVLWLGGDLLAVPALGLGAAFLVALVGVSAPLCLVGGWRVRAHRIAAERVARGDRLAVELLVRNEGRMSTGPLTIQDENGLSDEPAMLWMSGLAPGKTARLQYEVEAQGLGPYELGPARAVIFDPLGLVARRPALGCAARVLVVPRPEAVRLGLIGRGGTPEPAERTGAAARGPGVEHFGVREHRPEDGIRKIHWPSTARTQRLMSREFEAPTQPSVRVHLDTTMPGRSSARKGTRWERRIETAASLAVAALERGGPMIVSDASGEEARFGESAEERARLLAWLAQRPPLRADEASGAPAAPSRGILLVVADPSAPGAEQHRATARAHPHAVRLFLVGEDGGAAHAAVVSVAPGASLDAAMAVAEGAGGGGSAPGSAEAAAEDVKGVG